MKLIKKAMIMGMMGTLMMLPMSVQAGSCANGSGVEVKGNDHGTYCKSAIKMNWWSAHAWCDAIGMKLVPMEECECRDESKCDMTKHCPNLFTTSQYAMVWMVTPNGNNNAYSVSLDSGNVFSEARTVGHYTYCMN